MFIFRRKTVQRAAELVFKGTRRAFASGRAQAEPGRRSRAGRRHGLPGIAPRGACFGRRTPELPAPAGRPQPVSPVLNARWCDFPCKSRLSPRGSARSFPFCTLRTEGPYGFFRRHIWQQPYPLMPLEMVCLPFSHQPTGDSLFFPIYAALGCFPHPLS